MYLLLIAISFLASAGLTLYLRRLDRTVSGHQQIKRAGDLQAHHLEELAEGYARNIKDAVLEFEVLVRQSKQLQSDMKGDLDEYEERIRNIREDRQFIDSITQELGQIARSAGTVSEQVEKMDLGLQRLGLAQKEMEDLQKGIQDLHLLLERKQEEVDHRVDHVVERLIEETRDKNHHLTEQIRNSFTILQEDIQTQEDRLEHQMRQTEMMAERISSLDGRMDEKWLLETGRVDEKLSAQERKFMERLSTMESGLSSIRNQAVESMQTEMGRMRSELDNFNLDAIARRDEITNETRRMAEKINDQIQFFQEKYISAENKLLKLMDDHRGSLDSRMEQFDQEWSDLEESRFTELNERIGRIHGEIETVRTRQVEGIADDAARLREEMRHLAQEMSGKLEHQVIQGQESIRTILREEERNVMTARDELHQIRDNLTLLGQELKASLRSETEHSMSMIRDARRGEEENLVRGREELQKIRDDLLDRVETVEGSLREVSKIRQKMEEYSDRARRELQESQEGLILELEKRAGKFLSEQDEKLGHLNQTMDDKISRQITAMADRGQFHLDELEKRTTRTIREYVERVEGDLQKAREEFQALGFEIEGEMENARRLKENVLQEIESNSVRMDHFQERLRIVDRAEELTVKLDETVEVLTQRLREASAESSKMDEFTRQFEAVRQIRKEMEGELRQLESQRQRLSDSSELLTNLDNRLQSVNDRFDSLASGERMAEDLEGRVHQLSEFKVAFDKYFVELADKRKYIENAIRYIEKSRQQAKAAMDTAETMLQKVDRAEIRQEDIQNFLKEMESRLTTLNRFESEIQKVEARFEQMEGLMGDLENRTKQIGTMSRRLEDIKGQSEELKVEMDSLLSEADEKMEKLTAFYQTIDSILEGGSGDSEHPEDALAGKMAATRAKKGKKEAQGGATASGLSDWKREGILSLYLNHKWDPDLIAERTKIDPAVVRAVIQSHS